MIFNSSLSGQTKTQLIERLLAFPETFNEEPTLHALLTRYTAADQKSSFQNARLAVKGRIEMAALEVNDALQTIRFAQRLNPAEVARNKTTTAPVLPAWLELKDKAIGQGKAATQNNKFGILDGYYSENVQPKLTENRGSASKAALYPSPEYQDLELLLQILQEVKAKPMFILVPVKGTWYDYIRFPKQERQGCYARTEKMVRDEGFQAVNFGEHEYDSYFLQDTMHLGWKGWVDVDEALDQFYHEGT